MSKNTWKFVVAATLASSGLVAFACGGGSQEGGGTQTPSASATETATPPASGTAETPSATATATTPPPPTLPDSFKAADDARKTAEGKIATITAKKGTCAALAKDVTKLAKDNGPAYQTWNSEYSKLDDAQKGIVTTKAPTADDITAAFDTGTTKTCVDKKDKTFATALKTYATAAMAMPGATPAASGSAAPKKK